MSHDCSKEGCTPGLNGGTLHVLDAEHGVFSVQSTFSGPAPAESPLEFASDKILVNSGLGFRWAGPFASSEDLARVVSRLEKRLDALPKTLAITVTADESVPRTPEKAKATPVSEQLAVLRASRERLSLDRKAEKARRPLSLYILIALTAFWIRAIGWLM